MAHKYDYPSGGKGDTRIPPQISEEEFDRRWRMTFGQEAPAEAQQERECDPDCECGGCECGWRDE